MTFIIKKILSGYKQQWKPIVSFVRKNTANKISTVRKNRQHRLIILSNGVFLC